MLHFFNAPPNCTVETLKEVSDFVLIKVDIDFFSVTVNFFGLLFFVVASDQDHLLNLAIF